MDINKLIIGKSKSVLELKLLINKVAVSESTVLVLGETGTGKELVAEAIHKISKRKGQFVPVNCAAIPSELLESELFGHEKGSFTGASSLRIGKFEQCDGGTIFLDEIGDMPSATQTKILRVLQDGVFERVGGDKSVKTDVRLIAATNKLPEMAVSKGDFREDLFYRLNVVRVELPALRERKQDIPQLVSYFLSRHSPNAKTTKTIQNDALAILQDYDWPGNVRELENVVQRALVMAKGDAILLDNLPNEITNHKLAVEGDDEAGDVESLSAKLFNWARDNPDLKVIPAVERELVINALKETGGNQVQAAKILGITRATLRKRIEQFSIRQELSVE